MPDQTITADQIYGLKTAASHELALLAAEQAWINEARPKQIIPLDLKARQMALMMTGRGWGKTLSCTSWVRRKAGTMPGSIGHVIAPTFGDLRGTVFEGHTGLLKVIPGEMILNYNKSHFELSLVNGTLIRGFSSEVPDRMRGPQCHWLWGDEVAAWQYLDEMLSNIDFSTRLVYVRADGSRTQPQRVYSTTPRPLEQLRAMAEDPKVYQVRGSLQENKANLAETFIQDIEKHEGTKLGDQEIHGIILDFDESAIIKKKWLRMWPKNRALPPFEFIYVSMDTALTEETYDKKTREPDYTACTVWGVFLFEKRMNVMLLDASQERLGMPELIEKAKAEMRKEYGHIDPPEFKTYVGRAPALVSIPRKPQLLIVEDAGGGRSLMQMLAKEKLAPRMHAYNPGGASKMTRLNSIAHIVKGGKGPDSGRVWLIESAESPDDGTLITDSVTGVDTPAPKKFVSWADDFIGQFCMYTGPDSLKFDDYVDSGSQAIRWFADNYVPASVSDKLEKPPVKEAPKVNPYG